MTDYESANISGTLSALRKHRAALRSELAKVEAGIAALESLGSTSILAQQDTSIDYSTYTLADAAEDVLQEAGKGMRTPELWEKMQEGGSESESGNPVNTVYAVLSKNKRFYRDGSLWKLSSWESK